MELPDKSELGGTLIWFTFRTDK